MSVDKRGNTGFAVLIIVAVVLGLGLAFVFSDGSSPTGYAGSPVGAVTFVPQETPCSSDAECTPPDTCQYYPGYGGYYCGKSCSQSCETASDCPSDFGEECCDSGTSVSCVENSCTCIGPCNEGSFCDTSPSLGEIQCGGAFGFTPAPSPCLPNNPIGPFEPEGGIDVSVGQNQGACDCDNDGCTEGARCAVFGVAVNGDSFPNPCGPNGHCIPTGGSGDGLLYGQCACGEKPCELIDAEGDEFDGQSDQCIDTPQCEPDASCASHADCGGVGLGNCIDGNCQCHCESWAPCESDFDCGGYGEGGDGDGNYGQCAVGEDGVKECMCTDDLGCSPEQCVPGVTPCTGADEDCGGQGPSSNCNNGVCDSCGYPCEFFCAGSGACDSRLDSPLIQEECDDLAQQLGSDVGCMLDEFSKCDCADIPFDICRRRYTVGVGNSLVQGE